MKIKQFAVLGLGRFGEAMAITLSELGANVIAVDSDEDKVQNIADKVTYAVQTDVTDFNALKAIGIGNVDAVIVALTANLNSSIVAVINAQELGVNTIYAKAHNRIHERVLKKLGVERVFSPEHDMGERMAHSLYAENFFEMLELDTENSIMEIDALHIWENKSLLELDFRGHYGVNVIAIRSEQDGLNVSPLANDIIKPRDTLVLLGRDLDLNELKRQQLEGR